MMRVVLIAAMLAADGGDDRMVEVRPGESLEALAERAFGEAAAADELRAFNRLSKGARPKEGERLRLPGPERAAARGAVDDAAKAVGEAPEKARPTAEVALSRARSALRSARYGEAVEAARDARVLAGDSGSRSRFSVSVTGDGATRVSVREGIPVLVEAQGKATPVATGKSVHVTPGLVPDPVEDMLPPPRPSAPVEGAVLRSGITEGLVGPLAFSWSEVAGAARYVVLVSRDLGGSDVVSQHELGKGPLVTALYGGHYYWRVCARGANGLPGRWSPTLAFTVEAVPPKLEVGTPTWK